MPGFANTALRLLRRVLGSPSREQGPHAGVSTVLDGNTAVAVTEAGISEAAGLGAAYPAETADLAWRTAQWRHGANLSGSPLSAQTAESPRGALAAAIGLAMSGVRASSFLAGPDLVHAGDMLSAAAGRRLPLVLHLSARALAGHATALGSGHQCIARPYRRVYPDFPAQPVFRFSGCLLQYVCGIYGDCCEVGHSPTERAGLEVVVSLVDSLRLWMGSDSGSHPTG